MKQYLIFSIALLLCSASIFASEPKKEQPANDDLLALAKKISAELDQARAEKDVKFQQIFATLEAIRAQQTEIHADLAKIVDQQAVTKEQTDAILKTFQEKKASQASSRTPADDPLVKSALASFAQASLHVPRPPSPPVLLLSQYPPLPGF